MKYGKKYNNQPQKEDDEGMIERWGGDGDGDGNGWGRGEKQDNNRGNRNEIRE